MLFIHCFGVIAISGQVIGRLLCYMANLTLTEWCLTQTQGPYMQLTIFSNLASGHTRTHSFSLDHIRPTCDISVHMVWELPLFLCFLLSMKQIEILHLGSVIEEFLILIVPGQRCTLSCVSIWRLFFHFKGGALVKTKTFEWHTMSLWANNFNVSHFHILFIFSCDARSHLIKKDNINHISGFILNLVGELQHWVEKLHLYKL